MGTITGTDAAETLNGTSGDDTILGLGGNDILNGGAGHDILTGGAGADILNGGIDSDIYQDTSANFNGDEITNLKIGDEIQITDLDLAHGSIGLTGNLVTYNNNGVSGSITIDNVGAGRLVLRLMNGGVDLRLQQDAHNDFNGDGKSDLLWRNDNGLTSNWLAQANGSLGDNSANFQVNPGSAWKIAGTGDFNGDGRVDILWRNDNGLVSNWLGQQNGGFTDNGANSNINPGPQWHIAGTGDFNGDGRTDILWRNDNGLVSEWTAQANGSFTDNSANFQLNPGTAWHIAGTGDFNGDGYDDILWRNDNGLVSEWLGQANGKLVDNSSVFQVNPGTSWHVAAIGDFNGDGRSDILWRNDNGLTSDWLAQANGNLVDNSANFQVNPGTSWHVVQTGDFNGDSIDDILWRNDNGLVSEWVGQANGALTDNSAHFQVNPGTAWHPIDPAVHDIFPFA